MNDTPQNISRRLGEQLERDIYELEERLERERVYYDEISLKHKLAQQLYNEAINPEDMDVWEFELQILDAQKRQTKQEMNFLHEDLEKQRRLYELLVKKSL